jgi:cytochrome c553
MKLDEQAAKRLLKAIRDEIELDKMIENIEPMTDEEIAEIEARLATMPPLTPEEMEQEKESTRRIMEYMKAYRAENPR